MSTELEGPTGLRAVDRSRWLSLLLTLVLALPLSVGLGGPATADTAPRAGVPPTVSADSLPTWQLNGVVWDTVVVGNTVYATGRFTKARPPGTLPGDPAEITARNIFAFDIRTGERVASFAHALNGQGLGIEASPDGRRLYVGGDFTRVDGKARWQIAAFDLTDNTLDPTFRPRPDGEVRAIAVTAKRVFFGGAFRKVGTAQRNNLAAVSTEGAKLTSWAPSVDSVVRSMTLTPKKDRVIVGGQFLHLNGQDASGSGSVSASTGASMPWAANQVIRSGGTGSGTISLHSDGTRIWGSAFRTSQSGNFEGTWAADPDTGELVIVNDCRGDTYDTYATGGVLYTVGHAHDCSGIGSFPEHEGTRQARRALAFTLDARATNVGDFPGRPASALLHWYPRLDAGTATQTVQAAWTISGNARYVVMGGEFPRVNGRTQSGLARFAVAASAPNLRGPEPDAEDAAPTAVRSGVGRITLRWPSYVDQDNQRLRYQVFRNDVSRPLFRVTRGSLPWNRPRRHFVDTSVTSGSTYTYRVRVLDSFGNAVWMPDTPPVKAR